ncbi:MAG: type II toxin-antitoxin system HicA family toxin [Singulisphaera sp.]
MSRKHDKTLAALFSDPVRANIAWDDVQGLLSSLGAVITEGSGSRVRVVLGEAKAVFHEPHPEKELSRPAFRSIRDFLVRARVVEIKEGHDRDDEVRGEV